MTMLRILIADDHAVVRHGIKQILREELDIDFIAEARNAEEAMEMILRERFDILILDISMPGRSGLELIKEAQSSCPQLPILVLSMHPEDQLALRILKAGASGYLTKDSAPEELVSAVRKILSGGRYVSAALAERMVLDMQGCAPPQAHEILSDREYEVMRQIASGNTVSEIARILSLSVKTVSTYRTRVLLKMGMNTNAELTHYAVRNRLVD